MSINQCNFVNDTLTFLKHANDFRKDLVNMTWSAPTRSSQKVPSAGSKSEEKNIDDKKHEKAALK